MPPLTYALFGTYLGGLKMKKQAIGFIVDEHGVVNKEIYIGDRVRIIRESQRQHLQDFKKTNKSKTYCKVFCKASDILASLNLTASEYKLIFAMLGHIGFAEFSGYLIKVQCNMFCGYLNGEELKSIANMQDRTFWRAIDSLVKKEIIAIEKVGRENHFLVNPFIFMKNDEITRTLFNLFCDTKFNYLNE